MKKILILLLCIILAGCSQQNPLENIKPTHNSFQTEDTNENTDPSEMIYEEESPPAVSHNPIQVVIYHGNDNSDGFETINYKTDELTNELLITKLIKVGVLSEGTALLSTNQIGTCLHLDFNSVFRDRICSMGTSGEYIIMGSLVNTFLENYMDTTQSIYITVDGDILESGHVIYDFEMSFYN